MEIKKDLFKKTIYQIFVRNYSNEGTFEAVRKDLRRIKDLGVDIVYLMPIHPIGLLKRKGTMGSPYAIKDYYAISEDLGTLNDFKKLIDDVHDLGMQIIIDMVFNHTSPDSVILNEHEDYYYHKNGKLGNRCGDWSDIIDLDTSKDEVQNYLVDILKYWINVGVDGFRFDVASIIPLSFFKKARKKLGEKPIFLAESVHPGFLKWNKELGFESIEEHDLYEVFDISYCYNTFDAINDYLEGKTSSLNEYYNVLWEQEKYMPKDFNKTTALENHDQKRLASKVRGTVLENIVAYTILNKGTAFIYAGEEYKAAHLPELFEKDPIDKTLKDQKYYNFIKKLISIKKQYIFKHIEYINQNDKVMMFKVLTDTNKTVYGIFNLSNKLENMKIENGEYLNLIDDQNISIKEENISCLNPLFIIKKEA